VIFGYEKNSDLSPSLPILGIFLGQFFAVKALIMFAKVYRNKKQTSFLFLKDNFLQPFFGGRDCELCVLVIGA
jgi:hypothetical protein